MRRPHGQLHAHRRERMVRPEVIIDKPFIPCHVNVQVTFGRLSAAGAAPRAHPWMPVRFQNSAAGADLRLQAARSVLVGQSSQYRAASDPVVVTVRGGVIGAWRDRLQCSVWPAAVVVGAVLGLAGSSSCGGYRSGRPPLDQTTAALMIRWSPSTCPPRRGAAGPPSRCCSPCARR